ncbi:MAG: hypothetical protein ACN4G0_00605, partial [Polyangiales bacterium]
ARPAPLLPPPLLSPWMDEDQLASIATAPKERPKVAKKKPVRRKPRRKPKPDQKHDRSILDPWN